MTKRLVNLNVVNGWQVPSGSANTAHTVTCDIPVGPTYHKILIRGNAGTGKKMTDLIGEIRIKINGKVQRTFTADELNKLNELNGTRYAARNGAGTAALFELPIFFAEPWRKTLIAQEGFAWGTADVQTFQIEVDIKADTFTAAVALTFRAEVEDTRRPLGVITKFFRQTAVTSASAWNDIMTLPRRDNYMSIHVVAPDETNRLNEFEVKVDNSIWRQNTLAGNDHVNQYNEMDPKPSASGDVVARTGWTDIVFDQDDIPNSALSMVQNGVPVRDFNLRLSTGSAGTSFTIISQLSGFAE